MLLSLREAQALRRAMQAKAQGLPPVILFTLDGHVLAKSFACRKLEQTNAVKSLAMHTERDFGRQCARFFDGHLFYTNEELFRLFDPSSPTMPYVYDNFKWDHCTGVNSSAAHGTHG